MDNLYNKWKDFYYDGNYISLVDTAETVDVPEYNAEYVDYKALFDETKQIKSWLQQCDYLIQLAHKSNIVLSYEIGYYLIRDITEIKIILDKIFVSQNADDSVVKFCNDKDKIKTVLPQVDKFLRNLERCLFPYLFSIIENYRSDFMSVSEQIREVRNEEVIKSLSNKFKKEAEIPTKVNVVISVAILIFILGFAWIVISRELPSNQDIIALTFFYVKQFSIFALFGILLRFLFILRKEFSRLEQSYRHKEVLASSFINFQEQISKMPDSIKEEKLRLNSKLLEVTIEELGKNPIDKLDDKNKGNKDLIILENNLLEKIILKLLDKKV